MLSARFEVKASRHRLYLSPRDGVYARGDIVDF